MRTARLLLASVFVLSACSAAAEQQVRTPEIAGQSDVAAVEREVREFYAAYAEDLRRHRREALANRYDPRGVFFLGNGRKSLRSFEANRSSYLTRWEGPKSFEWRDLSVEVVSPDAAVVIGLFEWQTDEEETLTYSYTGLLVRRSGEWRIRVEDESSQPSNFPAQ